jgi:TPR repeat protein
MRKSAAILALVTALSFFPFVSVVLAGPLEEATKAYEDKDWETALRLLKPLAEKGEPSAQYYLSLMYGNGRGVPRDDSEAEKWYRKAAEQGHVEAQLRVAFQYQYGSSKDYAGAAKWYRKAAEQGNANAQNTLGIMYNDGQGVPQDYAEAAKWYRKAAEQGSEVGQVNLANKYYDGQGVPQDYTEAARWYRMAADRGFEDGQVEIGLMYYNGEGVPQDYVLAHMWLNIASSRYNPRFQKNGYEKAVSMRNKVASKMTPNQIAEAQRLAREWKLIE